MSSTNRGMYWGESGVSLQDRSTLRLGLIYVLTLYIPSAQCRPVHSGHLVCLLMDCMHLRLSLSPTMHRTLESQ